MTSMKRVGLAMALVMGVLGGVAAPPVATPHHDDEERRRRKKGGKSDPPTVIRQKRPYSAPRLTRYHAIQRVGPSKQHDQQDKLVRRAARQANDDQLHARQKAKWG